MEKIIKVRVTQHFRNKFAFIKNLLEDVKWMNMEREGGPTPWLKALLSRVAKETSGDEV